jgi:hypothetical protein
VRQGHQLSKIALPMEVDDSIAMFAVIVSIVSLCFTLYLGGLANRSKVLFEVFNEFRSPKFNEVRALAKMAPPFPTEDGIDFLLGFEPYREYSYFLNHIGLLLHKGYVNTDEIYQMAGLSIVSTWELLSPYILALRQQTKPGPEKTSRTPYYQFHFEYLVGELLEHKKKGNETIERLMGESARKISTYSSK